MNARSNKGLAGAGIIAAIASSLCCIVPAVAALASLGGLASSFTWIEPARPYLIGFTVITLGIAWYLRLRPEKITPDDCDCEPEALDDGETAKPSFWQTKAFLAIITVFAAAMMAFPYYNHIFYPRSQKQLIVVKESNIAEGKLIIEGMTCTGCENHIINSLNGQEGVIGATASYEAGSATVRFDQSKNTLEQLANAVEEETGYKITKTELIQ